MATKKAKSKKAPKKAAKTGKKPAKAPKKAASRPKKKAPAATKARKKAKASASSRTKRATTKKARPAKKASPAKAPAKRAAPKPTRAKKAVASSAKRAPRAKAGPARRDATGHLAPAYAADLRRRSREGARDGGVGAAFLREARSDDDLAEQLGEEFLETATSGEAEGEDVLNQEVPEERGGPFVITSAGTEFARGVDASNPRGARREPFPRT